MNRPSDEPANEGTILKQNAVRLDRDPPVGRYCLSILVRIGSLDLAVGHGAPHQTVRLVPAEVRGRPQPAGARGKRPTVIGMWGPGRMLPSIPLARMTCPAWSKWMIPAIHFWGFFKYADLPRRPSLGSKLSLLNPKLACYKLIDCRGIHQSHRWATGTSPSDPSMPSPRWAGNRIGAAV